MAEKNIKILHICDSFNMGGLENGVVNIINGSADTEICHEICCIRRSGAAASRLNEPVYIKEINKPSDTIWGHFNQLVKTIKQRQPDIVHTRNWGAIDGIVAARLARVKTVIHGEHGWNIGDPGGMNLKRRYARGTLSLFVDQFISVSEDIRQWLKTSCRINPKKIRKIINGVDTGKFYPDKKKQKQLKSRFKVSDKVVIGAVGRLDPIKKFDLLVEAFSRLKPVFPNVKLIIAGDGSDRMNITKKIAEKNVHEDVMLLGERNDLQDIYKIMDIFVLPSLNEGISNTILEAMASGLPVVATRVGGNPELVDHGETGLLVSHGSIDTIHNALNYYLEYPDMATHHGHMARMKTLKYFSLEKMVNTYNSIYRFYGKK